MNADARPITGAAGADPGRSIVFDDVSRFYGEVLGVNRIQLTISPGITGLVGPNGSGKTTLMNLMTGLIRPSRGRVSVLGKAPEASPELFRRLGYCSQFDSFPRGLTGFQFVESFLRVHGYDAAQAESLARRAIDRVGLTEASARRVAAYSKGMRQRIRLAQAISHEPEILILDEPLNGLDPMARAEVIGLFKELRDEGRFVIVSSHILHELDMLSDRVVLLSNGYVVAEGDIHGVREEIDEHPMQVLIRCDQPAKVAASLFEHEYVVGVEIHADRQGLLVSTREAPRFFLDFNQLVVARGLAVESVAPADDDVRALYQYLIEGEGKSV